MATLSFATTDRKVFTPIAGSTTTNVGGLSNGPGTLICLTQMTTTGSSDFLGVTDAGPSNWYHLMIWAASQIQDDNNVTLAVSTANLTQDTTNWWWIAVDWAGGGTAALERMHWKNQTTNSAWTHTPSVGNGRAAGAGPGTSGWIRIGAGGDNSAGSRNIAAAFIWAGTRFTDTDYDNGTWTSTGAVWNHALGNPQFATELNTTTPTDLAAGSTYSSTNSSGTTLTGGDPTNYTFDGTGGPDPVIMTQYESAMDSMPYSRKGYR